MLQKKTIYFVLTALLIFAILILILPNNNMFTRNSDIEENLQFEEVPFDVLSSWSRRQIAEYAIKYMEPEKSDFMPNSAESVKVYRRKDGESIKVELGKGLKAYDDQAGVRRIDPVSVGIEFMKGGGTQYSSEGDMKLTDDDKRIVKFVMEKAPLEVNEDNIVIINENKNNYYEVYYHTESARTDYRVDKSTGDWAYISHKQFDALDIDSDLYTEINK